MVEAELDVRRLRRELLKWYDRHRRDLPWRRRAGDGYAQLLAEFMLQQTQVATVVGYYERFMERFPTVTALAAADVEDVLSLWAGLGYYSRARNLHRAAQAIVRDFDGQVPPTPEQLLTLPGVGRYTAGAIASIAYDVRAAAVDGNVTRVLMRLTAMDGDPKEPAQQAQVWSLAESCLPPKRCGDFNQALMELGATVCSPKTPRCLVCPLKTLCQAHLRDLTDRIPRPARRARVIEAQVAVVAVRRGERLLFRRRPAKGLWAGLWELPSEPIAADEPAHHALSRLKTQQLPAFQAQEAVHCRVERQLTHRRIMFHLFLAAAAEDGPFAANETQDQRWMTLLEARAAGISRACEAILAAADFS